MAQQSMLMSEQLPTKLTFISWNFSAFQAQMSGERVFPPVRFGAIWATEI